MAVLVDVRYLCTECGYAYSNGAEPLADRDLDAETQRAREIGERHMGEVHGKATRGSMSRRPLLAVEVEALKARVQSCEATTAEKVLDLRHLITTMTLEIQKVRADTDRLCREADAKKFEKQVEDDGRREKALARLEMAIGTDARRHLSLMDGGPALIQGWVAAGDQATESLAESIRAFMRSKGYEFLRFRTTPFSGSSDSDSKDALIRDLLDCFADRRIYPPHEHALSREKLCRRAEKLGVKC